MVYLSHLGSVTVLTTYLLLFLGDLQGTEEPFRPNPKLFLTLSPVPKEVPAVKGCPSTAFTCLDKQCIPIQWHCDGDKDCDDGSDEDPSTCKVIECQRYHFKCKTSQKCIPKRWVCNQEDDCGDMSDEADCLPTNTTCSSTQFSCLNKRCIPLVWQCEGYKDCEDGSDEDPSICTASTCSSTEFSCLDKECIPLLWHCDGAKDCEDGSDEDPSFCKHR